MLQAPDLNLRSVNDDGATSGKVP